MVHPCRKPLLSMILIIMGASILIRDGGAVPLRGRDLGDNCACDSPCGNPCVPPSPPPPSPPLPSPPPPLPLPPPLLPPLWPATPSPPFCPPPPQQPYTPFPTYWYSPPGTLYPVDPGYHPNGAGRTSIGWSPVLVGGGLLALWL